jgi:uncharacterized RmlC-like cupin family protein
MANVEFIDLSENIHEDQRGLSFFPWTGKVGNPQDILKSFHLVSVAPKAVRGNHLHPGHIEWLYLFHSPGELIWEATPSEVKEQRVAGNRTLIRIPAGVAHAVRNPGPGFLYLMAWREPVNTVPTEPETLPRPLSGG